MLSRQRSAHLNEALTKAGRPLHRDTLVPGDELPTHLACIVDGEADYKHTTGALPHLLAKMK